ncbi:Kinesin light chain 3 [Melia azedarach]|uniref:Kinesin light chain 3 n=1 Tax=Melia azedarach TaxID=155640 RepID=A0ACC1X668_MELAZ|nr:Kinesin light chain 3 [Melia azedarach]
MDFSLGCLIVESIDKLLIGRNCHNYSLYFRAELYRVKKVFDKAGPLYLEAINILQESFGPEDIRVGVTFHNLGQFYLVRRKLEDACICYEIKGRVLGHGNID